MLAEFASVVDAVRCAAEVQRGMIDREPEATDERRIRFRIGVNLGDIIAEDGDIFGDGVNVAARLEALAEPGGICVSGTVRDQIRDKLPYPFEDRGEQSVKNIARPVRVYALRPEAVADLPPSSVAIAAPRSAAPCRCRNRGGRCGSATSSPSSRLVALAGDETLSDPTVTAVAAASTAISQPARGAAHVDRRAAFRQSQRRPGPAVFRRRRHRGSDDRSVADPGHARDLAQYRFHLPEQAGRHEADRPRAGGALCARRKRPAVGQPGSASTPS